jgi:hypothetical protein
MEPIKFDIVNLPLPIVRFGFELPPEIVKKMDEKEYRAELQYHMKRIEQIVLGQSQPEKEEK